MRELNLHQVRVFHAVAEQGSFTRAAASLFVSQPAVSRQVREVERFIDVDLVERVGRRARLTEAGQVLHEYSRTLFGIAEEAAQAIEGMNTLERGRLNIAASETIGTNLLPGVMARFQTSHPGVELRLLVGNTHEVLAKVVGYEAEFGYIEGPVEHSRIDIVDVGEDELVVALGPKSHLAQFNVLAPSVLSRATLVLRESGSGTREVALHYLAAAGIEPASVVEIGNSEAIKRTSLPGSDSYSSPMRQFEMRCGTEDWSLAAWRGIHDSAVSHTHPARCTPVAGCEGLPTVRGGRTSSSSFMSGKRTPAVVRASVGCTHRPAEWWARGSRGASEGRRAWEGSSGRLRISVARPRPNGSGRRGNPRPRAPFDWSRGPLWPRA